MEYSAIAQHKQAQLWERIPQEWRLSASQIPPGMHSPAESVNNVQYDRINVLGIPRSCGLLSTKELDITESWDVKGLLGQIHSQKLTSEEVIGAFCKVSLKRISLPGC
jgi:hypothetical protein